MGDYRTYRQRFNLSMIAWEVINNDSAIFTNSSKPSIAGMINMILEMYMDDSDAAIEKAAQKHRDYLKEQLESLPDNATKEKMIEVLVKRYTDELCAKATGYPCEINKASSLTKDNFDIAQKWQDEFFCYGGSVSRFFKAVLEEYSRKPYYEREWIILKKVIDELQFCIEKNQLIRLTLKDNRQYDVRPYKICHDPEYNYHYLIGMSKKSGTHYAEKATPFRISGIKNIRRMREPSGRIKQAESNIIEQKLKNSGAQFLLDEQEAIIVKLTAKGKKDYESQLHLRPRFVRREQLEDGSWRYTFNCTQRQAEYYFFKFGADAMIECPLKLKNKLFCKYQEALDVYKQ